jgi:hypothetical protein
MRRWVLVSLGALACVPSPADLCRRGVALNCQRQFECQTDAVKMSPGFIGGWGDNVDDCDTQVAMQAGCDDKMTQDDLCPRGQHFDLSEAEQCAADTKAQSCTDFLDPAKTPASCNMQCH